MIPGGRSRGLLLCVVALAATPVQALAENVPPPVVVTVARTSAPAGPHVGPDIVGGRESATNAYPWMSALYLNGTLHCAAVLIARSWALTAAHCAKGSEAPQLSLLIGQSDLARGSGGQWRKVKAVRRDPKFVRGTGGAFAYDVALVELDRPSTKPPLRIASSHHRNLWEPGVTVRALGWGATSEKIRARVTELRETELPIQSDRTMSRAYGSRFSSTTMVGAGPWKGGRDTCSGDSGGPLVAAARGSWWLVGLTSWGDGCARAGKPGVYARVAQDPLAAFARSVVA